MGTTASAVPLPNGVGSRRAPTSSVVPSHLSRDQTLAEARSFGIIGLLPTAQGGGDEPWAQSSSDGSMGDGLSGTGEGCSPCTGRGISLAAIGTIGHGSGVLPGGVGYGGSGRGHMVQGGLSCRCGETSVHGRLPPEAIQRIVQQSFGRFRFCYEDGLARDPSLAGRVSTKFVIDRDGSVATVADAGSDLHDDAVVACVGRAFGSLSFPEPAGGVVNVTYPLMFSPDT